MWCCLGLVVVWNKRDHPSIVQGASVKMCSQLEVEGNQILVDGSSVIPVLSLATLELTNLVLLENHTWSCSSVTLGPNKGVLD